MVERAPPWLLEPLRDNPYHDSGNNNGMQQGEIKGNAYIHTYINAYPEMDIHIHIYYAHVPRNKYKTIYKEYTSTV